ncbi:alpha/beta hydrolase [Rickettsiales endosymbiont of Stachyamoeba lipophora]|uniref:alpha/beta hydrolase n=1 Tax=Rickettsiales endosymbiont of Stachyamoeba lipophora TaxID=2486578 RepID=UPI0013DE23AE|nr:dienelactone hydrolase family protein [Rickettsiales endosymbiont of Stachyamoeba lipophora]
MINGPEVPPISGNAPKQLCIILHGYGADGFNLIDLARIIGQEFPDMQFIAPNAPHPFEMGDEGHQWFSLYERSDESYYQGVLSAEKHLNEFLDYQLKRFNLAEENLIVMGFSQGCMTAVHTMLRREKACALVVGFSGRMLGSMDQIKSSLKSKPTICLIHGKEDEVVMFEYFNEAKSKLKDCGVECNHLAVDRLGHSIDYQGLKFAVKHIRQAI